jgi:hypothetical protein
MFPFIQCHHTRGRALFGGFSNPACNESLEFCATANPVASSKAIPVEASLFHERISVFPFLNWRLT